MSPPTQKVFSKMMAWLEKIREGESKDGWTPSNALYSNNQFCREGRTSQPIDAEVYKS